MSPPAPRSSLRAAPRSEPGRRPECALLGNKTRYKVWAEQEYCYPTSSASHVACLALQWSCHFTPPPSQCPPSKFVIHLLSPNSKTPTPFAGDSPSHSESCPAAPRQQSQQCHIKQFCNVDLWTGVMPDLKPLLWTESNAESVTAEVPIPIPLLLLKRL